jgi:hypothetical protein
VARGDGTDYSAAHVFNIGDSYIEQQAEYYGKVPTDEFGEILSSLGERYNNASLIVENNSIGLACINKLKDLDYPSLYFTGKGDQSPGEIFDTSIPDPDVSKFFPGFTTSNKIRPLMLNEMSEYIRHRKLHIRSERLLNELLKFVWNNGKPQAMKGYNDDLVMALAIACWMNETFIAPGMMTEDMNKQLLNLTSVERTDQTQIPGATKDPRYVKQNERISVGMSRSPYEMSLPDGTVVSLGWLINSK